MKTMKTTLIVSALAMMGGCVAVPVGQSYYAPAPVYIAPPAIYVPSVSFGYYGGRGGGYRHR